MKTDPEIVAWDKYRHHRKWFNKLEIALTFGYRAGPSGIPVPISGFYVVRPIYNLVGMGLGATKEILKEGDQSTPPGFFWSEYLPGTHYTVDIKWNGGSWDIIRCLKGRNKEEDLSLFTEWEKADYPYTIPSTLNCLSDVGTVNFEAKESKIFEVHLRPNPDPNHNSLIPVFQSDLPSTPPPGYRFISAYEDCYGFLSNPRVGFFVR